MKSILLKTFAAALLAATAQAEVHVLGVVWKERGLLAPEGTIDPNPGTVAATRGYMIFDETILTATPGPGTLILYTDNRSGGSGPRRTYTIDATFRGFNADLIMGATGGKRIYGHMIAPTSIADVPGSMIPFSGTPFASGYPNKLRLDDTVFQTVSATALTGPVIVDELEDSSLFRSVLGGSATAVNVASNTIAGATEELEDRLDKAGFERGAVAPVIVDDLDPTLAIQDGDTETLSVVLGPNVFPTPTYKWFRNDVQVATTPTFNVVGGAAATGAGTYRVEVSTAAGTAVSGNLVVTPLLYTFATNLPPTVTLLGASSTVLSVVLNPTPITAPTYQWFKAPTATPTVFTAIPAGIGGTSPTLTIIGGEAATGAGVYKVEVTSLAGVATSASSAVTVNATVGTNFVFTTNTPRTATPTVSGTVVLAPVMNAAAVPSSVSATRQWEKAPLSDPTNFTNVDVGNGGNVNNLTVSGSNFIGTPPNEIPNPKGPGVYRLKVTSIAAPVTTVFSIETVVTTGL